MTAEGLGAYAAHLRAAREWIAGIEDEGERFTRAQEWSDLLGEERASIAPVRQDAFRAYKVKHGLTLERASEALGIPFGRARRIANAKLKRDEPGE